MNRVPELTRPAARVGLGEQNSLSAARPEPAPSPVSPAVAEHALLVTVPRLERRVAELERVVVELRSRLGLVCGGMGATTGNGGEQW